MAKRKSAVRPRANTRTSSSPFRSKASSSAARRGGKTTLDDKNVGGFPPSSLMFEARPSAARSGRAELVERLGEHTETTPAMTGGDVDANWEQAYSSGDEAPGGDNPTPDQTIVDNIGRALGVE